jgi:phosphoglycerol transferase MdoB-like AlkP superfamily enzyme
MEQTRSRSVYFTYALKVSVAIFGIVVLFETLARVFFYNTIFKGSIGDAGVLKTFWMGLRFDMRYAAIIAVVPLLLFSLKYFQPKINKPAYYFFATLVAIVSLVLVLFYVVDYYFYDYRTARLDIQILNYLNSKDQATNQGMVQQSYPVVKIILFVLLLSALLFWSIKKTFHFNNAKPKHFFFRFIVPILLLATYNVIIVGNLILKPGMNYPLRWSDASKLGNNEAATVALNPMQSFFSSRKFAVNTYDEKLYKENLPTLRNYLGVVATSPNLNRAMVADTNIKTNVVVVLCESFSSYKSTMFGNALNPSPFFDSLCKQGTFFTNCYTPAYGTARGVWALITGIPDVQIPKDATRNPLIVNQHTIVNDLKGLDKYYFIGGKTAWANIQGVLVNNIEGLQLFEQDQYDAPLLDVWGVSDHDLFRNANKKLAQATKPFFAVIQTANNHRPYSIPEADKNEMGMVNVDNQTLQDNGFATLDELNAYRYSDFCFKKFMQMAAKEKYYNNTMFVFIGDHGIRTTVPKNRLFSKSYYTMDLGSLHVPLLFFKPGMAPKKIDAIASQVDVLPTIAGLLGNNYTNTTFGEDLFAMIKRGKEKAAFTIDHDRKMIGVIYKGKVFRKNIDKSKYEFSYLNSDSTITESYAEHEKLTDAYFQSARYILYHNKKTTPIK